MLRAEPLNFLAVRDAVLYAGVMKDKETGQSRGCGSVEFETVEQAMQAINMFNGSQVLLQTLFALYCFASVAVCASGSGMHENALVCAMLMRRLCT